MRKKIKKAFTLVELLVVIAILAILATVSIVGYNSFTKKAKVSNDTALVSQLNTLLKADSMVNGDAKTPTDALKITSEAGYDVEKLTPTTNDYEIIWNQAVNQFALLDEHDSVVYGEKSTEEYKNWKFVSEYNANSTYSMYLKNNTSINTINDLKVGLDVGTNKTITAVNYTNSETKDDVVIRTNGGTLTVDAASDTIKHFGSSDKVVITAVASHSFHEYGIVRGNIELANGRVVMETGSSSAAIKVVASADNINNGTIISIDTTKTNNVSVVVPAEVKDVIENKKGDNQINSSNVITDADVIENMNKFSGGLGTEASPYLISTNDEFANIISGNTTKTIYYNLISDVEVSSHFTDTDRFESVANTLNYCVFDGLNHTIKITDNSHLFNMVLTSTIRNLNGVVSSNLICYAGNSTFENIVLDGKISTSGGNEGTFIIYAQPISKKCTLTFKNCTSKVNFTSNGTESSYNSVFVGYAFGQSVVTVLNYDNCSYEGTFVSGKSAMFLGNNSANDGFVTINVNNCKNNGIIQSTIINSNNYYWNSYIATGIKPDAENKSFKVNTIFVNGNKLTAENIGEPMGTGFIQGPNDANLKMIQNSNGQFVITASENVNVAYYEVSIGLYSNANVGGTLVQTIKERVNVSNFNNNTYTSKLKNLLFVDKAWVEANSSAVVNIYGEGDYSYTTYTLNGVEYYYLPYDEEYNLGGKPKAAQMISVSCFDESGNLIASASLSK